MSRRTVLIRAGIPDMGIEELESGNFAYPVTTTDFAKILRENGFDVSYDHPREKRLPVSLNAAETWLPILVFAADVLKDVPSNLIASMILNYFAPKGGIESKHIHVEIHVVRPDGTEGEFKGSGHGPEVVKSIDAFQQTLR